NNWDTSHVTDMSAMFSGASAFTQNISAWNVAKVTSDLHFDEVTSSSWTAEMKPHFSKAVIEWSKTLPMTTLAPGGTTEVKHPSYVISDPGLTDRLMANKTYTYRIKNIGERPLTFDKNAVTVTSSDITIGNNNCKNASLAKGANCSFDITASSQTSTSIILQLTTADADIANPEDKILSDVKIIPEGTVICSEVPVGEIFTLDGDTTTHYFLVVEDGTGPSGIKNDNIYGNYINSDMNKVCTTHVTDMSDLFHGSAFNRNINDWDTSNVTNMSAMFSGASVFNQPLNDWNTSNVTNMSDMFYDSEFNQPLNDWNTGNVTDMSYMFDDSYFNWPLNDWNTGNVTNMRYMFAESRFNQPLYKWDTSKVTDMSYMFHGDVGFCQDLSAWDVANVIAYDCFDHSTTRSWREDMHPKFR
ncbi:BspA family leucine-rich repeat surface protein, partial [Caedibacter taeniospiralis]|uniref:BspA family leucine-rich repeat surface protein n=1 Tax=Caedibacter taeniospiralis TaxID=28907 RepID=UPI001302400A